MSEHPLDPAYLTEITPAMQRRRQFIAQSKLIGFAVKRNMPVEDQMIDARRRLQVDAHWATVQRFRAEWFGLTLCDLNQIRPDLAAAFLRLDAPEREAALFVGEELLAQHATPACAEFHARYREAMRGIRNQYPGGGIDPWPWMAAYGHPVALFHGDGRFIRVDRVPGDLLFRLGARDDVYTVIGVGLGLLLPCPELGGLPPAYYAASNPDLCYQSVIHVLATSHRYGGDGESR